MRLPAGAVFAPLKVAVDKLHGGPPIIPIDKARWQPQQQLKAAAGDDATSAIPSHFFLGVLHFWVPTGKPGGSGRHYRHYLYRMEGKPPFRVLQVSSELKMQTNPHYK